MLNVPVCRLTRAEGPLCLMVVCSTPFWRRPPNSSSCLILLRSVPEPNVKGWRRWNAKVMSITFPSLPHQATNFIRPTLSFARRDFPHIYARMSFWTVSFCVQIRYQGSQPNIVYCLPTSTATATMTLVSTVFMPQAPAIDCS